MTLRLPGPWTHHDVSANGIRLHVAEQGSGPLVVLLHGFPEFWWAWRHQVPALAGRGFRVAAVDLRGYGESDKTPRGYDLWTLAGDVSGLIGALGEARAHVVGHGWGGLIGWSLAALHPRRVAGLVTIAAPHPLALRSTPRSLPIRAVAGFQLPRWAERSLTADDGARVERLMRAWAGSEWGASADFAGAVRHYRAAMQVTHVAHCSMEYFRWAARSQVRADGRRFAAALSRPAGVPVLQIHGADDPCVRSAVSAASEPWAGRAHRLVTLPGTGHFPHEERPDVVTGLVGDFLRGRP